MDELVKHCIRELACEGELGCDIDTLKRYINEFWSERGSAVQTLDIHYFDFVWKTLASHPGVYVGTIPEGALDVIIAPQNATKRLLAKDDKSSCRNSHLNDDESFGEEETSVSAASSLIPIPSASTRKLDDLMLEHGSHLRIAVSSDVVLTSITGTHVRPAKLTPMVYTCLQFISRVREKGITMIEIGARTGYDQKTCFYLVKVLTELNLVSKIKSPEFVTHVIVHKHFLKRNPLWIQSERNEGPKIDSKKKSARNKKLDPTITQKELHQVFHSNTQPNNADDQIRPLPSTSAIDPALMNETLIHHPHEQTFLSTTARSLPVPLNSTMDRLIYDSIIRRGNNGVTMNEIHADLGRLDKRVLELLVNRAERVVPPSHLRDLAICDVMENFGRERRHKYFTLVAYRALTGGESMRAQDTRYQTIETSAAGGFLSDTMPKELFYRDDDELKSFQSATYKGGNVSDDASVETLKRKRGRPRKFTKTDVDEANLPKTRRGKPGKYPEFNVEAATPKKRGRPRKYPRDEEGKVIKLQPFQGFSRRKRGRPRKYPREDDEVTIATVPIENADSSSQRPKMRCGRPSKNREGDDTMQIDAEEKESQTSDPLELRDAEYVLNPPYSTGPRRSRRLRLEVQNQNEHVEDQIFGQSALNTSTAMELDNPVNLSEKQPTVEIDPQLQVIIPDLAASKLTTAPNGTLTGKKQARHINLSAFRRKEELMRILDKAGGIMDSSPHILRDAHAHLLEEMSRAGEPTSMPVGMKGDRKTIEKALSQLEDEGRMRSLITTLPDRYGLFKRTKIIYKSETTPEALEAFLKRMGQVAINQKNEHNSVQPSEPTRCLFIYEDNRMTKRKTLSSDDLDNQTESALVRSSVLKDKQAVAQLYGAPLGRIARARQLHILALREFNRESPSHWVVSNTPNNRVLNISFFWNDINLSAYCAVVPVLQTSEELDAAFSDESTLAASVKHLPQRLRNLLQVGLSRSRERLRALFDILSGVGLVTPLRAIAGSSTRAESFQGHPQTFEVMDALEKTIPTYWKFEELASLWKFDDLVKNSTLIDVVPVRMTEDAVAYWTRFQALAIGSNIQSVDDVSPSVDHSKVAVLSSEVSASLTHSSRWRDTFLLTKHQSEHLHDFVKCKDFSAQRQGFDRERSATCLAWTIAAPEEAILLFFDQCAQVQLRKRLKAAKSVDEAKHRLAEKSRQAKAKLQERWDLLVGTAHAGTLDESTLHRLQSLKEQYVTKGSFARDAHWKREIYKALHVDGSFRIQIRRPHAIENTQPVESSGRNKSVRELVSSLSSETSGFISRPKLRNSNKKEKEKSLDTDESNRRQRFQWNRELDELARDVSVIIRARCRSFSRMDWGAVQQVFPNVARNSVRQRIARLSEEPAAESYLRRLEDAWYRLWLQHRSTDALPDGNPDSASDFDLIRHLEFLRANINKASLQIGIENGTSQTIVLPKDVISLATHCSIVSKAQLGTTWDLLWMWGADDNREKILAKNAFLLSDKRSAVMDLPSIDHSMAAAVLKMVLSTTNARYDEEIASNALKQVGEIKIVESSQSLLDAGVLSKTLHDSTKKRPGRMLRISDANQSALDGPLSSALFKDAKDFEQELSINFQEWSPLSSEGETAALLHLISANLVDIRIDSSRTSKARDDIDLNSKKVDDEMLEADLELALKGHLPVGEEFSVPTDTQQEVEPGLQTNTEVRARHQHGDNVYFCGLSSDGVVNCSACLADILDSVPEEAFISYRVLEQAGSDGLSKSTLANLRTQFPITSTGLRSLQETKYPLAYWVGFSEPLLVCAAHIRGWGVVLNNRLLLPRRWIDLVGSEVGDIWEAACRAVIGIVLMRPGITEVDLRNRLHLVYDRGDLNDVIIYLTETGVIRKVYHLPNPDYPEELVPESETSLFIGPKGPWSL